MISNLVCKFLFLQFYMFMSLKIYEILNLCTTKYSTNIGLWVLVNTYENLRKISETVTK